MTCAVDLLTILGKPAVVEYEPDSDLRDTEQVPLLEETVGLIGGILAWTAGLEPCN